MEILYGKYFLVKPPFIKVLTGEQVLTIIQVNACSPFCYGNEENGHYAWASGHLTTANQSDIGEAYLVSVL